MSDNRKHVLAVPNFSNGQDPEIIEQVTAQVRAVEGVTLVSVEPEHDFNRTVVTMIGEPQPIKTALVRMGKKAAELIDMSRHKGSHPRIGAEDTLPIFPLMNITLEETTALAEEIGREFFEETGVPVFFAGENARAGRIRLHSRWPVRGPATATAGHQGRSRPPGAVYRPQTRL